MPTYADLAPFNLANPVGQVDAYNARIEGARILVLHAAGIPYSDFTRDLETGSTQTVLGRLERNFDETDEFYSLVAYLAAIRATLTWRVPPFRTRAAFCDRDLQLAMGEVERLRMERDERRRAGAPVLDIPPSFFHEYVLESARDQAIDLMEGDGGQLGAFYRAIADELAVNSWVRVERIRNVLVSSGMPFGILRRDEPTLYLGDYLDLNA